MFQNKIKALTSRYKKRSQRVSQEAHLNWHSIRSYSTPSDNYVIIDQLKNFWSYLTTRLINTAVKRPFKKMFYSLIGVWFFMNIGLLIMFNPFHHVSGIWWFNSVLTIWGMFLCSFVPYNKYTKWPLWYATVTMIIGTTGYFFFFIFAINHYFKGEASYFFHAYENFLLQPFYELYASLYEDLCQKWASLNDSTKCEGDDLPSIITDVASKTGVALETTNPQLPANTGSSAAEIPMPAPAAEIPTIPQTPSLGGGFLPQHIPASAPIVSTFTGQQAYNAALVGISASGWVMAMQTASKKSKIIGLTSAVAFTVFHLSMQEEKQGGTPPDDGTLASISEFTVYDYSGMLVLFVLLIYYIFAYSKVFR